MSKISSDIWQYGKCRGREARRHIKEGNVQFVLWKRGDQGHLKDDDGSKGHKCDKWVDFDCSWWKDFKKETIS